MADTKITALSALTDPAPADLIELVDDVAGTPTSKKATLAALVSLVYPIGCIYQSVVSTAPETLFGFGTWAAFGAGRVVVGLDSGDTDFDSVEETGGAKTHTLTTAEMPSHTHVQDAHSHLTQRYPTATGTSTGFTIDTSMSGTPTDNTLPTKVATAVNQNTGGGGAHNNLPPYIVVYRWKRTA